MNKWECKYCGSTNNADYRERCWACGAPAPLGSDTYRFLQRELGSTSYTSISAMSYPVDSHTLP